MATWKVLSRLALAPSSVCVGVGARGAAGGAQHIDPNRHPLRGAGAAFAHPRLAISHSSVSILTRSEERVQLGAWGIRTRFRLTAKHLTNVLGTVTSGVPGER